jgi:hypothetical protein
MLWSIFFRPCPAVKWLTSFTLPVALPGLVAMELLRGCRSQSEQQQVESELAGSPCFGPQSPTASVHIVISPRTDSAPVLVCSIASLETPPSV